MTSATSPAVTATALPRPRWMAHEVVQTSAMDCGPATLKCLLEGFRKPVSYGRLREACQTDVDGTSIDTIESVAGQLGVNLEQVMLPLDHLFLKGAAPWPAIVVVQQADLSAHFVVVWRQHGNWLQVMDPAVGRRWVRLQAFRDSLQRHRLIVSPLDWRQWAGSEEFIQPLRLRLGALGAASARIEALLQSALADPSWFALGTLDASTRLVQSLVSSGGVRRGREAHDLLEALYQRTRHSPQDVHHLIPPEYWTVAPNPERLEGLVLRGAVLLRVDMKAPVAASGPAASSTDAASGASMSADLVAALNERTVQPLRAFFSLLRADGLITPLALALAMSIAVGALVVEALLFRGIFDMGAFLSLSSQRLMAALALLAFLAILLMFEWPIISESVRAGRRMELRLRMALLDKLPKLSDRYFHSRPVSDMAERSHSLQMMRALPAMAIQSLQACWELVLTVLGLCWLDAALLPWVLVIGLLPLVMSLLMQPVIAERDLRVRSHSGALLGFYLDALLGLVPIRAHRAAKAVSRQHEALLVEWMRASLSLARLKLAGSGVQALFGALLAAGAILSHFERAGGVTGADLLLVYWLLKLPAIGARLSGLALQYPAQRNVLLRLLEPLTTPETLQDSRTRVSPVQAGINEVSAATLFRQARHEEPGAGTTPFEQLQVPTRLAHAAGIWMRGAQVTASGHTLLQEVNLSIAPGEHVAIVGASGAGKSTLMGLLLGWHRLAAGQLYVDGQPLDAMQQEQLRRETAWIDPAVQLWNRPFIDNLNYASADEGLERMAAVLDAARLRGVLQKLPTGLQSLLGEGGSLLSGGEGQRVRLGRALMQQGVRLALLDEPFRGLDRVQRRELMTQLRGWWKEATLLCVTHDIGETLSFDRVLVIDDGRIVQDGHPASLASCEGAYQSLLSAEAGLHEQLWQGEQWRRIQVSSKATPAAAALPPAAHTARISS